jgi:spore coat protein H
MTSLRIAIVGWCVALSACVIEESYQQLPPPTPVPDLVENRDVYTQDRLEILTVHLTVTDLAGLDAVNQNVDGAKVPVVFQSDDYVADPTVPNGTLQLRGSSSRESNLHSYKVKLTGDAWRGMTKLNLVKHPYDLTRVRNRLSFEYMRMIPNFTSLRTQFVHVYMNGEDLGLFENVENPSKPFLAAHGLPAGELYKANNFAFLDLTDVQRVNTNELDKVLESKGVDSTDHAKLQEMLKHVNDSWVDSDYVFARHFNLDNYTTWLAVEILLGNFDTANQNFMIFSPPDSDGWYLMPWDYDGAWGFNGPDGQPGTQDRAQSRLGVGTWWLSPLHKRFLSDPKNIALLEAKMDQLMATVLSDEKTQAMLASYHDIVKSLVTQSPDVDHLPDNHAPDTAASILAWETEYARIGTQLGRNYEDYYKQKDVPMPIFQAAPLISSDQIVYQWDTSYSLVGDSLTYDLEVSKTPAFNPEDLVLSKTGLTKTLFVGPSLPSGQYFWRVRVRDARAGTWQESAELYNDGQGHKYPGVLVMTI